MRPGPRSVVTLLCFTTLLWAGDARADESAPDPSPQQAEPAPSVPTPPVLKPAPPAAELIEKQEQLERERRRPLWKKAWFWGVVGSVSAVVIGTSVGVGLGVGLKDDRTVLDFSMSAKQGLTLRY